MKKIFTIITVIVALLLLGGCSAGQATIKHIELTDAEKQLAKAVGGDRVLKYMVDAKLEADTSVKWVMEHYYQGERIDDVLASGMVTSGGKQGLTVYFASNKLLGANEEVWNLTVGEAAMSKRVDLPGADYAYSWEPMQQAKFELDRPIIMAVGVYSSESLYGIPDGIFADEASMDQLLRNQHVYILKVTFSQGD